MKVLLEMLPNYYHHVRKYGASLLTKFYGLHVVRPVGGLKVNKSLNTLKLNYFVVFIDREYILQSTNTKIVALLDIVGY